jgi:hypothetical protein
MYDTTLHFVTLYCHNFLYFAFLRSEPDSERYDGRNRIRKDTAVRTGSGKIRRSEPDMNRNDGRNRNRKDTTVGTGCGKKIRRSEPERYDGRNRKDTTVGTGIRSGSPCARQARQAGQPGSPEEPPSFSHLSLKLNT